MSGVFGCESACVDVWDGDGQVSEVFLLQSA